MSVFTNWAFRLPDEEATCGWPQLASFMDSCDNFGIYRRFGQSHSRILVMYMTDITNIEKQLDKLDQQDSKSDSTMYRLKTSYHREGLDARKRDLLTLLEQKLLAYSN
jgi:hypothetical protein